MTSWYVERTPNWSAKAVTAMSLLALLLVAAVPVALLAAVAMMMLGHVVGGLEEQAQLSRETQLSLRHAHLPSMPGECAVPLT